MTPERAREVHQKQSEFPHWGNYRKFMTEDEIAYVQWRFDNAVSGNVSFASIVCAIMNGTLHEIPMKGQ